MTKLIDLQQAFGSISDLAASGIREVPAVFKFPSKIQDCLDVDCSDENVGSHVITSVPVIDLSDTRTSVLDKIRSALEEWGFFQVVNHGVPPALMDDILRVYKLFFELPLEEKMKYYTMDRDPTFRFGVGRITPAPAVQNWKDFAVVQPGRDLEKLPAHPPTFRDVSSAYNNTMIELKRELLGALSESLGLGSSFIDDVAGQGEQFFVCNYYPPCPQPEAVIGTLPHSDFDTITVLLQDDVGGLEILDKHRNWIPVKPLPHALVINAGDQLEILSNGKFKSVQHRVRVNSEKARLSIATFINPQFTDTIGPPSQIVGEQGPLYKDTVFADYTGLISKMGVLDKALIDTVKVSTPPFVPK